MECCKLEFVGIDGVSAVRFSKHCGYPCVFFGEAQKNMANTFALGVRWFLKLWFEKCKVAINLRVFCGIACEANKVSAEGDYQRKFS